MQKTILLFLFTTFAFAQGKTSIVEANIYNAIDAFVAHPDEKALVKLESAEKDFHPKSKPELLAFVILNCNKAYYQNQFGQTQKAVKSYEKAWQIFKENDLSDYDIIESCLQPLANLYTIIGDYDNAENLIRHYFMISLGNKNLDQVYAATLNLSNVYHNTGRSYFSIELVAKTLKQEKLTKTQQGILQNNLGNNFFAVNDLIQAKNAFEASIRLLSPDPKQSENLSNTYRNLAKTYAARQDFALANWNMQKAEALFLKNPNKNPRKTAQFHYDKAVLDFAQNDFEKAQQQLNIALKILIPNYPQSGLLPSKKLLYAETALLDAFDLQADLYNVNNQPKKALQSYDLSFYIEELLQSVLVYENSKIIMQIRNRNRTEKCIEIYNLLFQKEKKTSYVESAFLLSEQTKSSILKQTLRDSKTISREEKLILSQLQNWNTIIVKEQQKASSANISKISKAIEKQNELMLLLKSKRTKKTKEKRLDIADLHIKLKKDKAVLVEYFMGLKHIYVFTLENGKTKLESIVNEDASIAELKKFIDMFSDSKTISNNPLAYNHLANVCCQMVKLPKKNQSENLIIIPDGILNFLPFEALVTRESKTTSFAKMDYLLNDFTISYNNSADFYLNAIPSNNKKPKILGVFPIFEKTDFELAFSKKELQNLQQNFEGKYLSGKNAVFGNFKADVPNYSILHLSTHAASGDIFDPASIKFYDQEVLYSEFYNLDLNADLVVLSACETGIGKLYKAEGAMSIARGFQFAGAQNLLFSLWKVNDFTTSVLMEKFYYNLKNGQSYADSNHQAKLDFLNDTSISNAKKSPYYWSSFVYYGTLENAPGTNYFLWISLFGGLIALLLLWKTSSGKK